MINQSLQDDFGNGVGSYCYNFYKGLSHKCNSCPVQKTFEDRKVNLSEETVELPNGQTAKMDVYSAPIFDAKGDVAAVLEERGGLECEPVEAWIHDAQSKDLVRMPGGYFFLRYVVATPLVDVQSNRDHALCIREVARWMLQLRGARHS